MVGLGAPAPPAVGVPTRGRPIVGRETGGAPDGAEGADAAGAEEDACACTVVPIGFPMTGLVTGLLAGGCVCDEVEAG